MKRQQQEELPPLWVVLSYQYGMAQISQVSMVWLNETPETMQENAAKMVKDGGWYRLGNLNNGIVLFPASALIDIKIRLATPDEVERGNSGAGAAKIP